MGFYKHPTYGQVYGDTIVTPTARCCWPSLVKPKDPLPPREGQAPAKPRYELTVLLPKGDKKAEDFVKTMQTMSSEMVTLFNQKRSAKLGEVSVVQDGDAFIAQKPENAEKYPFYKGCYILVARNANKPKVVNREQPKPAAIPEDSIKGGMKVKLVLTPVVTASGVSYKLEVAQLVVDDGTRFGGGVRDMVSFLDAITPDEEESEAPVEEKNEQALKEEVAEKPKRGRPSGSGKQACVNLL